MTVHNEAEDIRFRHCRSTLYDIGTGIIIFSAWSAIKTILFVSVTLHDTLRQSQDELFTKYPAIAEHPLWFAAAIVFSIVLICLLLALGVFLNIYVGMRARAEANGKRCSRTYIVFACLMVAVSLLSIGGSVYGLVQDFSSNTGDSSVVGIVIEVTSAVLTAELIVNAVRFRRMSRGLL